MKVIKQEKNTIFYICGCGAKGMCSLKPSKKEAPIVLDLVCPNCQHTERITLLQYIDEKGKKKILDNLESIDLVWSPFVNEEIEG
jgi:predicted small lipoprotein YifL